MDYRNKSKIGVIEVIIGINIILFIPWIFYYVFRSDFLLNYLLGYGALNVNRFQIQNLPQINNGAFWQLITSIFIHGGMMHIIFNMYALYMFGKPLEERWGKSKFLAFYLTTGILANAASAIFFIFTNNSVSLIGASGAIFGVLLAFGGYYPNTRLLLFFFIPMKVKWAILAFACIELYAEISGAFGGIAHVTHLFGFLFGFLYLVMFFNTNPVKEMFFPNRNDHHYYQ